MIEEILCPLCLALLPRCSASLRFVEVLLPHRRVDDKAELVNHGVGRKRFQSVFTRMDIPLWR